MLKYTEVFSEYDIEQWGIQFEEDAEATIMDTLGTAEETMEVRTVTKQKRNMPWKTRTKATGAGEVKISAHVREDVFKNMFGMYVEGYKDGVTVYGSGSTHKQFCMTELVTDEDGNQKLKAYPVCTVKEGLSRKVETNSEEIAEVEMTISVDPDPEGVGLYEIVVTEATETDLVDLWMKDFGLELVKVVEPTGGEEVGGEQTV